MSLRVLIVEDEPLIALDLKSIFDDAGHRVVGIAINMSGALHLASVNQHLDLAIMDIDLADGPDGLAVAQRLREDHDIASLFVSARLTDEARARALTWGPVGFVGKPFREQDILRAISGLSGKT